MLILALDTTTQTASVALYDPTATPSLRAVRSERVTTHSDRLLALIDELFVSLGARPSDLAAVACASGPGSFTGLRIGLSTAKGLCLALGCPLVLVPSLEALAARGQGRVWALLDAHKGELYAAEYDVDAGGPIARGEEAVLTPEAVEELLARARQEGASAMPIGLIGDGLDRYPQLQALPGVARVDAHGSPRAEEVALLGARRLAAGLVSPLGPAVPRYVRPSEAELLEAQRAQQAARAARAEVSPRRS
jgi:tRNA threonylcarbamoyladenosine biosynthesis protein TsaB